MLMPMARPPLPPRMRPRTSPAWRPWLRRGVGLLAVIANLSLGSWSWPVTGPVLGDYIAPASPYSAGHRGIDIAAPIGVKVRAPAAGVVHFVGWVVDRPVLSIDHGAAVLSSYEPVTSDLAAGDEISGGEIIGRLAQTDASHCAESCLHLGVRVNGDYVNPLLFLGGVPWSVLYPDPG